MREDLPKPNSTRKTAELRKGRLSVPDATYFVTFCTAQRAHILAQPTAATAAHAACQDFVQSGVVSALTTTVMPDHVHLLFRLENKLCLDRVVSKWKAQTKRSIPGCEWQANFYEHRLRPDEPAEPYAWYIFMNPYQAGLISCDSAWPGWWTDGSLAYEFLSMTRPGPCPQSEWLGTWQKRTQSLMVGSD